MIFCLFYNIMRSLKSRRDAENNPWDAVTLEWSVSPSSFLHATIGGKIRGQKHHNNQI